MSKVDLSRIVQTLHRKILHKTPQKILHKYSVMVQVLWSLCYDPSTMVPTPWFQHYGPFLGPSTMVPMLWSLHFGPSAVVPALWSCILVPALWSQCNCLSAMTSALCPSAMVPELWSKSYDPIAMVPDLIYILNIIGCSPYPIPNAKFETITIHKK